jgi:hypothetical protein
MIPDYTKLSKVAEKFGINEETARQCLLDWGNKNGKKVLHVLDGFIYVVPHYLYTEIRANCIWLDDRVVSYEDVMKNASDSCPITKRPSVYFLIDQEEIVYIGQSKFPLQRIADHVRSDKNFDRVSVFSCEASEMDIFEAINISRHDPVLNIDRWPAVNFLKYCLDKCIY